MLDKHRDAANYAKPKGRKKGWEVILCALFFTCMYSINYAQGVTNSIPYCTVKAAQDNFKSVIVWSITCVGDVVQTSPDKERRGEVVESYRAEPCQVI